jgi:sigma-B regulation protein RsbU (phosphoserine phosphatase)
MASALQGYVTTAEADKELELASRVCSLLAPGQPLRAPGAVVATRFVPSELGGATMCDAFAYGRDAYVVFSLARAEQAGIEGLSALLLGRSRLASLVGNFTFRPQEVAAELNRELAASGRRLDLLLGVVDLGQGWLTLLNTGCPYPYLVRADGELAQLDALGGPRLGQRPEAGYADFGLGLEPGDRLVLYSPHVVQVADAAGAPYGLERFEQSLQRHAALDAEAMQMALSRDVLDHAGAGQALQDDLAIVVVQFQPEAGHGC